MRLDYYTFCNNIADMSGEQLRNYRHQLGWTQVQAARRARVSQPYWSLMEHNRRSVPPRVVSFLLRYTHVSPTALPVTCAGAAAGAQSLAASLGALGYPGFLYLRKAGRPTNPACLVFEALQQQPLEPRVAAALPWVLMTYPDLDWSWLLDRVKLHNLQNRLGFLTTLARHVAGSSGKRGAADLLSKWTRVLDDARLVKEDEFGRKLTDAERRYLREQRPDEARHWNVLTNLKPDHLQYVT